MRSKKRSGNILIIIGIVFIAAAAALVVYNLYDEYRAGKTASSVVEILQQQMPDENVDTSSQADLENNGDEAQDYVVNPDMEMPTETVDENNYIGTIEIPSLNLSLPIIDAWSYAKLKIAPCRYSGSAYSGNFTIAGHNYSTHFGPIRNLEPGAQVIFTDMKGRSFTYEVSAVETLEPTAVEDMISNEWDLTLFTCTSDGQARVAVRCFKMD